MNLSAAVARSGAGMSSSGAASIPLASTAKHYGGHKPANDVGYRFDFAWR